jgi:hypothetical protein
MAARPVYIRLLRLRHLKPHPVVTFLLFEGSIGLSVLLALAEIVNWWGLVAIPVAVAVMVKLNDVVAGSLGRPLAVSPAGAAHLLDRAVIGRSPVPRPGRPTVEIHCDDAVFDPAAAPDQSGGSWPAPGVARGVAVVPAQGQLGGRRPLPGVREPEPPFAATISTESAEFLAGSTARADTPSARRTRGNQGRFTT